MVSNAILDQSREGKVATSAAELRVCASAHAGRSRPVPRLSVSTGFHPCLNAESQKKIKINMSPGDGEEEDGRFPTSNQRSETQIWPLVYLILSFPSVTFQCHTETAESTTHKKPFSS